MSTTQNRLREETALYERHKPEWLTSHGGQFVVVRGTEVLGFFEHFADAYYAGVEKYGTQADFLVKRIVSDEPVFVVF